MDDNIATVRAVWPDAEVWGPLRTGHRWMVMLPHGVSLADTIGDGDTEAEAWRGAAEQAGRESLRRSRGARGQGWPSRPPD
jgi:hypothetical protein